MVVRNLMTDIKANNKRPKLPLNTPGKIKKKEVN